MAEQSKKTWPVVLVAVLVLIAIFSIEFAVLNNNIKEPVTVNVNLTSVDSALATIDSNVDSLVISTAARDAVVTDSSKVDKLCTLTDGCEFYTPSKHHSTYYNEILQVLTDKLNSKDFNKSFANLVGIDRDYLNIQIVNISYDNVNQIRAYTLADKKDGNWEVQTLVKVKYFDEDRDDEKVLTKYVVVKSILDEGEYDSLTLSESTRDFEFE